MYSFVAVRNQNANGNRKLKRQHTYPEPGLGCGRCISLIMKTRVLAVALLTVIGAVHLPCMTNPAPMMCAVKPGSSATVLEGSNGAVTALQARNSGGAPKQRVLETCINPPIVYSVENTGADCPPPPLPSMANLPVIQPLPDPFMWSGTNPTNWSYPTGRTTNFTDWRCRRAEIKAELENYEIGPKPAVDLQNVFASYSGTGTTGTLTVRVTNIVSGTPRTLTLTCAVALPAGPGPFPVVIGMNSPSGSIPERIFSSRNIARITFRHNQVTVYGSHSNSDPFYQLYPHLNTTNSGQYAAWAWGVSRIVDGLYKLQGQLGSARINLERIAVTGCSYAGKMALFAGALDERIALTVAQEPGGGGAAAWRVSETLGNVEKLGATDRNWFKDSMFEFAGANVSKLPHDHHELCAMVCPRALLVLGNPPYVWLAEESTYVSCRAALEVYKTFGIEDRFGFNIVGGHSHCVLETTQSNAVVTFVEKFLLGNTNVDTRIRHAPDFAAVDYNRWIQWWGTTNPVFPSVEDSYTQTFEPECETVGTNWLIVADANASNGKYVTARRGVQSLSAAPTNSVDWIIIPFTVTNSGSYLIAGRVYCPDADGDSFWIKVDNDPWVLHNNISPKGVWVWYSFGSRTLKAGQHILYIGYREDDALLDKISVSDHPFAPTDMGVPAANLCP